MFPVAQDHRQGCRGFPRMRGDVPEKCPVEKMKTQFSPHARGCSASLLSASLNRRVFPACAGMFPCFRVPVNDEKRFPRMRGDVPNRFGRIFPEVSVFPACAGMFRSLRARRTPNLRFPRMRGDVPGAVGFAANNTVFSPHARGCSQSWKPAHTNQVVFPACAGMFLSLPGCGSPPSGFPRMRGDVPATKTN